MSNKETKEIKEPTEQLKQEASSVTLEDLKIAYIVGLTEEDQFIFELFGKEKGLVQLLGIHQHANKRVEKIYDDQQMSGDRLMHEVGRAVAEISRKLGELDLFKDGDPTENVLRATEEEAKSQLAK